MGAREKDLVADISLSQPRLTVRYMQSSIYSNVNVGPITVSRCISRMEQDHAGVERAVLRELLLLDGAYRDYYKKWQSEQSLQRMAVAKLLKLSHDYRMFHEMSCASPKYPTAHVESIVSAYQVHYHIILSSNATLNTGVGHIRKNLLALRHEFAQLDLNWETPFVLGDAFHKPIEFFMDLAEELFKYFHCNYLQLDCGARHLDPPDLSAADHYQQLLQPCEEFEEYFLHNLGYCQCLLPLEPCPPVIVARSPKPSELEEQMMRARHKRCAKRLAKMAGRGKRGAAKQSAATPTQMDLDMEHEERMNSLSMKIEALRRATPPNPKSGAVENGERQIVQQIKHRPSPKIVPHRAL